MTAQNSAYLLELAAKCEAAEGPDRELDCLIFEWARPDLDPAVDLYRDDAGALSLKDRVVCSASTPALALTSACLKALAVEEDGHG